VSKDVKCLKKPSTSSLSGAKGKKNLEKLGATMTIEEKLQMVKDDNPDSWCYKKLHDALQNHFLRVSNVAFRVLGF
jgi:hypothetical protein